MTRRQNGPPTSIEGGVVAGWLRKLIVMVGLIGVALIGLIGVALIGLIGPEYNLSVAFFRTLAINNTR